MEKGLQCDLCCNFLTHDQTKEGSTITVIAPNGTTLERVLHRVGDENGPLCVDCVKSTNKK